MRLGMKDWTKRNGLPSMPNTDISDLCHHLWSEHTKQITNHITKSSITQFQTTFDGAIFHCEDKQSSSLRIYCPCLYYQSIEQTFQDPSIFEQLPDDPTSIVASLVDTLQRQHGKPTRGQSDLADNFRQATFWPKGRKTFEVADPSFPLWTHLSVLYSISSLV